MKLVILLLVGMVAVFVGLVVAAASFVGCFALHMNRTAGSGHVITTNLNLTGFQSVEAGGTFVVNVTQGDGCAVSVTSDDNLLDKLSITQSGGWVHFGVKSGENISPTTPSGFGQRGFANYLRDLQDAQVQRGRFWSQSHRRRN
jgi:hypothetical protein